MVMPDVFEHVRSRMALHLPGLDCVPNVDVAALWFPALIASATKACSAATGASAVTLVSASPPLSESVSLDCAFALWWIVSKSLDASDRTSLDDIVVNVFPPYDGGFEGVRAKVSSILSWEAALLASVGFDVFAC